MNHHPKHPDVGDAFLPDPRDGARVHVSDDLAEALAEGFVESATSAEEASEDTRDAVLTEEVGGPFVEVAAARELDPEPDASNPIDGEQEPFPTVVRTIR